MSHITSVNLKIRDLDALKEAAEQCGLEYREGQKTFAWYGMFMGDSSAAPGYSPSDYGKCEHALRVPGTSPRNSGGPYEIGVVEAKDGDGYAVLYDSWGPGQQLEAKAGAGLNKLRQEYAVAVATTRAKATLARKGFTAVRENLANGRVRLRLRRR